MHKLELDVGAVSGYIAEMTGPSNSDAKQAREKRLAEALRANLHRRKAQARDRKDQDAPSTEDQETGSEER